MLTHSSVSFRGKDPAHDSEIRFLSYNGKQMLLKFNIPVQKRECEISKTIHSNRKVSQHFALKASLTVEIFQFWDIASSGGAGLRSALKSNAIPTDHIFCKRRRSPLIIQYNILRKEMEYTDGKEMHKLENGWYVKYASYICMCIELTAVGKS